MSTVIKHPVLDRAKPSFVIFDIRALERQSARRSKITNDRMLYLYPWQQWASTG